jgi:DNA-directed RNA polymerase delta subunit
VATTGTRKTKKADKAKKSFSVQYLEDMIFDMMLNTGQAAQSREIASALEDRTKLHPKFVRKILYYSDRFEGEDRRWNLALRLATHLSFEGSLEHALRSYGKPMAIEALQNEMALVHRRTVEFFDALLLETLQTRPKYWQTPDGLWALSDWLLDVSETDPDRCFLRNFFLEAAEVRPIVDQLLETRMSTDQPATEMAVKLVRRGEEPIGNRILGYVIWRLRGGDLDPIQFFQDCRQDSRLVMLSGLMWGVQDFVENWDQELKRLSRRAEKEEGVEWAEEEEPEGPVVITPADLEEVYKVLRKKKAPQSAAALAEAIYEFSPSSRRFQESVDALMAGLALDSRFIRVGRQTWALPEMMPKHADKVPPTLLPIPVQQGEDETDSELDDEGLEPALISWVHDPRYEDFGEEQEIDIGPEQQPTDELRYILLYDHWKAGTLKVRVCDRRFYPSEADLICSTFVDKETGKSYPVWLSYATSLLYEIGDWYAAREVTPGAVFALTPGSGPDQFSISFSEEMDPVVTLTEDRIKELVKIRREALKDEWSVLKMMERCASDHKKGFAFMTLWAEVNVIRRTTRRVVASNLASYHAFYQRPPGSDVWIFDERKVTQGRKKTKRKYLRR